jgi:hypothetical protein
LRVTAVQKFKAFLFVVALGVAVVIFGPQLAKFGSPGGVSNPRVRPTLQFGHSEIQYARPGPAPDVNAFRDAERDPDKAILYVAWKGQRTFRIEWTDSKGTHVDDPVLPKSDNDGFTTWAVVVDVHPGLVLHWKGTPYTSNTKGLARCDMYHRSRVGGGGPRNFVVEGGVECVETVWA